MFSITITGDSMEDLKEKLEQALRELSPATVPPGPEETSPESPIPMTTSVTTSRWGFVPLGVGNPEAEFAPIDDGSEWTVDSLEDWIHACKPDAKEALKILATSRVIDPREAAQGLGWDGAKWAGTWNGPRRQAMRVIDSRNLSSWPYGHTYVEPRRLWMHDVIAERLLGIL
jgi:hypothetical protein